MRLSAGHQVCGNNKRQVHNTKNEPDVDELEIRCLGEGGGCLGIKRDKDQECGQTHSASLRKTLHG